jgi:N-acetylglutamate synthase-like GNAT family acetyltransferase
VNKWSSFVLNTPTAQSGSIPKLSWKPYTVCALRIRRASIDDASALTRIAHDAKRYWGYPEHWIKHWQDELTISSDFVSDNEVYVLASDDELRGFYALVVRNDKAELEHLWVAPKYIGTGAGKELFLHAMKRAAGRDISEVQISADPNAEGFYKKMGAHRIGDVQADMDDKPRTIPRMAVKPTKS